MTIWVFKLVFKSGICRKSGKVRFELDSVLDISSE